MKTQIDINGYERIIDKYGIKHTINQHGNKKIEEARGQIAVVDDDFELIEEIVQSENIIFSGKNASGRNCLLYQAEINNTYFYIEEVRTGKEQLVLQTMYKRKPPKKNNGWFNFL